MSIFKNHNYRTETVTVQGVDLVITEPSAAKLARHHENNIDKMNELNALADKSKSLIEGCGGDDDKLNELKSELSKLDFAKTRLFIEINLSLISICLSKQFPEMSQTSIYEELIDSITEFDDVVKLVNAADNVCGVDLKE